MLWTDVDAYCINCGQILIAVKEMRTFINPPNGRHGPHEAFTVFTCWRCHTYNENPVCSCVVAKLQEVGIEPQYVLRDGGQVDLPPITHDELLDFHTALESL